jgi:hypothetical protein
MESKFQRQQSAASCKKPHRRQGKSNNNIAHAREMLIFYLIYQALLAALFQSGFRACSAPMRVVDDLTPALYIISHLSDD